jgi:hypothetical protein
MHHEFEISLFDSIQQAVILKIHIIMIRGKNEYLVLRESYPKEEASWVSEEDVTTAAIR